MVLTFPASAGVCSCKPCLLAHLTLHKGRRQSRPQVLRRAASRRGGPCNESVVIFQRERRLGEVRSRRRGEDGMGKAVPGKEARHWKTGPLLALTLAVEVWVGFFPSLLFEARCPAGNPVRPVLSLRAELAARTLGPGCIVCLGSAPCRAVAPCCCGRAAVAPGWVPRGPASKEGGLLCLPTSFMVPLGEACSP